MEQFFNNKELKNAYLNIYFKYEFEIKKLKNELKYLKKCIITYRNVDSFLNKTEITFNFLIRTNLVNKFKFIENNLKHFQKEKNKIEETLKNIIEEELNKED